MQVHYICLLATVLLVYKAHGAARRKHNRDTDHDIINSGKLTDWRLAGLNFTQYSGYLSKDETNTHYWFVGSENDPLEAPVLVWLNGGPGVSGLHALFNENGPFELQPDGKSLRLREFTWNKFANILYMDNPMGVGFSYQTTLYNTKPEPGSDEATSLLNYHALKRFFNKFPEFNNNPLYLMGQGYGGVYALDLARRINDFKAFPNLAGIIIGNGFLHANLLAKASVFHARDHGLIDDGLWKHVSQFCCRDVEPTRATCIMRGPLVRPECLVLVNELFLNLDHNPYNIQQVCARYNRSSEAVFEGELASLRSTSGKFCPARFESDRTDRLASYLQNAKDTLNIPESFLWPIKWKARDDLKGYTRTHAFDREGLASQMKSVLANKIPVMLYHGDLDMVCSSLGNEWFVEESVGLLVTERSKPWRVDDRIVGYKKQYEGLTFVTVEGAGHSAPMDKPREVFELIKSFISVTKSETG